MAEDLPPELAAMVDQAVERMAAENEWLTNRIAYELSQHYEMRGDFRSRCACGWAAPGTETWSEHVAATLAVKRPWEVR